MRRLAVTVDLMLVVGSIASSNSNRLRELAAQHGIPAYLIDGPEEIQESWLKGCSTVGVTAGASAPELLVRRVIEQLEIWGGERASETDGPNEDVSFSLPIELRAS